MIISVDFDGTCVTHEFPQVGKEIGASIVLQALSKKGHQLILSTMRCDHDFEPQSDHPDIIAKGGPYLTDATNWFKENGISLYGVQENPAQKLWTNSPKVYSELDIDDRNLGVPLLFYPRISNRPFVNWIKVTQLLHEKNMLTDSERLNCEILISLYFNDNYNITV